MELFGIETRCIDTVENLYDLSADDLKLDKYTGIIEKYAWCHDEKKGY